MVYWVLCKSLVRLLQHSFVIINKHFIYQWIPFSMSIFYPASLLLIMFLASSNQMMYLLRLWALDSFTTRWRSWEFLNLNLHSPTWRRVIRDNIRPNNFRCNCAVLHNRYNCFVEVIGSGFQIQIWLYSVPTLYLYCRDEFLGSTFCFDH